MHLPQDPGVFLAKAPIGTNPGFNRGMDDGLEVIGNFLKQILFSAFEDLLKSGRSGALQDAGYI